MKTKKQMIDFITSLENYPTMNSWNMANGYSYNIKIHSLPFTKNEKDALYEMLSADDFYTNFEWLYNDFEEEMKKYGTHNEKKEINVYIENLSEKEITKKRKVYEKSGWTYDRHGTKYLVMKKDVDVADFSAGQNGRSAGHLVLYKWNGHNYTGTGWTHDKEELEEMTSDEVKEIYNILKDFEKLYKDIIEQAKYVADNYKVEDESYTVEKTRKVLIEKKTTL